MRPDVFAAVMATGIVSIAAADHGLGVISEILIVFAAVGLPVLMFLGAKAWREFDMRDPDVTLALFTYVAACAVVGARLADHRIALWALGGMALQGWLSLAPISARSMWRHRWTRLRDRARGGWELAAVATSGLAIVFAELDVVFWAFIFWVLGICLYLAMTSLVLWRVRHDAASPELVQPDVWILMGGIAIATLAGDHLHHALIPGPIADGVRAVTIATWIVATAWIPVLGYVAVRRSVALGWPAVFPLGMYSSATYAMFVETGWRWFVTISLAFFWIAFAAWLIVAVGELLRFQRLRAAGTPSDPAK
ncbi:tellurite resistance/C4-dicarboxylate transporter family protein [Mycolicibacterium tusciae]|uniref:C4-dicarboxylate ABC transporter n=1 Tax=Mycolicibacterium tusciae TaxID=75922 RepID=A0A1X0JKU1_9MYCO|nr:tellurite resistance/C4-dicarboxylate transporter family protein [Mycolicibacterium tusciae]ORB63479.1 C4-dicarboxylate ABC transporter [Mycolicibacterium tusciae]